MVVGFPWRRQEAAKGSFTSLRARALTVLLLPAVLLPVAPAYAGGALIAGDDRRAAVTREVSVVRWDGAREQIVTRLTVAGDAPDAGWLLPVPARASVELGDPALFDQLAAVTVPSYRTRQHFWPQDGDWPLTSGVDRGPLPPGPRPGVGVVADQRLGPFTVTHLSATDPAALSAWLRAGGFDLPAGLQDALRPYVALRWQYVAIKLAPAAYGALRGALDPLHVTFAAQAPVYPMRLASTPVSLSLYVLAAHRMEPVSAIGGSRPRVTYAGRVPTVSGSLSAFSRETPYLTAIAVDLPTLVTTDPVLRRAASDTPVRQVVYADRLRTLAGIPAWLLTVAAVILALAGTAIHLAVRGNRARTGRRRRGFLTTSLEGSTPAMTGTTEETPLSGITARVAEALAVLRARVGGGGGGVPPMPKGAPVVGGSVGAEPGTGAGAAGPGAGAGSTEPGVGGIPPMPGTAPTGFAPEEASPVEGPRWSGAASAREGVPSMWSRGGEVGVVAPAREGASAGPAPKTPVQSVAPARGGASIPVDGVPPLPGVAPIGGFSPAPEAMPSGDGIPSMPRTAPTVGADFAVGGVASAGSPWWSEQASERGGASASYGDGVPVLPEEVPATVIPPRPRTAPDGASWGDVTERTSGAEVPPVPDVAPTVDVPPFPEMPPASEGHGVYDAPPVPRSAPRVPPMPSVPPYAPPTPTTDGGTAHLFTSPGAAGLHKYPFCAPPLNQNTFGTRHKHRRVQQVPRQGR
ncbi:DUF2330 domain-containing protein [Streptomyces acidiscabies]|uniref:DUF2330 domain-containing protein n=1 Tax=Streptomyces acidiscabies TaxID=42234 RepID=UPI00095205AA|nr:DUF2330 domain-containing protein [Streptomyces acidiscabies]